MQSTLLNGRRLADIRLPTFGSLPVAVIDTALVVRVLDPIWSKKPETASRLRGRIEAVLDFATMRGYRVAENPARWKGHLKEALPAPIDCERSSIMPRYLIRRSVRL